MIGKAGGHYRVLEKLDSDARGVVYKAEDIKLGRRVPLKFLLEELSKDRQALDRFQREGGAHMGILKLSKAALSPNPYHCGF